MTKKSFSFRAEPELEDVLQSIDTNMSFSEHIRSALSDYINFNLTNFPVESIDIMKLVDVVTSDKEFYTIPEFAKIIDRPASTVRGWKDKGWVKAKPIGGIYLIHRSFIEKILDHLRPTTHRVHTKLIPLES